MPYTVNTRFGLLYVKYRKLPIPGQQDVWLNNIKIGGVIKKHGKPWIAITYSKITPYAFKVTEGFSTRQCATDYIIASYKVDGLGTFLFNHERIKENYMRNRFKSSSG